jgi:hypothetical protein
MITFKKGGLEDRILELGGGANRNPISDVNCDVRPGQGWTSLLISSLHSP